MGVHRQLRKSKPELKQTIKPVEAPPYPHNVGKRRKITTIDGNHLYVVNQDEIVRPQGKAPHNKLIYFQKLRHEVNNRIEYRFTYYMLSPKEGRMLNRWVFGQYSLMIPAKDLVFLLKKARDKGWDGF